MTVLVRRAVIVGALIGVGTPSAHAQPRVEVGSSLVSTIMVLDEDVYSVGVPVGGGLLSHGAYLSLFLGSRFAVEPQSGFVWTSLDGDSNHLLAAAGQFSYFALGTDRRSPYLFGTVGIANVSGEDYSPKSFGGGAGYRIPVGDRLVFRIDGRYAHYTGEFADESFDAVSLAVSIGGVLGQR
jgi:hypothetical protein